MQTPTNMPATTRSQRLYTNAALTIIAGLLGVIALDRSGPLVSQANAQQHQPATHGGGDDEADAGRVSAADQRKVIIAELRNLSSRVDHLEGTLSKGISVKVTEMPPIQFPTEKGDKADKSDKKDDRKADKH
jgi:hypothetical protein